MSGKRTKPLTREQEQWIKRLTEWERSGESQMVFAKGHGIDLKHLYNWKSRLGKLGLWPQPKSSFVKAAMVPEVNRPSVTCRVHLQNGICVELESGSYMSLSHLLSTLSRLG